MAFAVYDNDPALGYIRWSDLHIQYQGVTYAIADGHTAYRFVWWDPDVSTTNLQVADTLPTLSDDAILVFLNKDGVHVTVPRSTVVDGSLIVSESILADALAANSVVSDKIAAGAIVSSKIGAEEILGIHILAGEIDTNHIAANAVTANKIAANTITSNELAADAVTANELAALNVGVGKYIRSTTYTPGSDGWSIDADGTAEFNDVTVRGEVVASEFHGAPTENMLTNGDFETDTSGWAADTADYPLSTITRDTTQAHSGSASLRVQASSAGYAGAYTEIPVQPGDIIHMTAWVKKGALHGPPNKGRNDVYVTMDFYNGATPIMLNGGTPFQVVGMSWQFIERYVAVPANLTDVTHVRVGYSSYAAPGSALYVDDVVVGKAPMMEIPYVVTNEDDSHLRSLILPDTVGFTGPYSSYPYGMMTREAGEGLPMLEIRGPSLGPNYATMRLRRDGVGGTEAMLHADEVYVGTLQNRVYPTPFLRVSKAGNQTIANDTGTVLLFDTVHNDTEGGWDGGSATYTVKVPGLYLIHYMIRWAPGTGNTWRQGAIRIDGTDAIGIDRRAVLASQTWYQQATVMRYLTVGQTVRIEARHTSGGNLAVEGGGWPQFLMVRIGDI